MHGGLGVICGVAVDVDVGTHVVRSDEQDVLPGRKGRVGKAKEKKGGHSFQDHLSFFVLERTLLDRVRCIRDKSLTDNLDSIIYRVATDVLEYTLKYTFGKRILDKTRVQEKPWLA